MTMSASRLRPFGLFSKICTASSLKMSVLRSPHTLLLTSGEFSTLPCYILDPAPGAPERIFFKILKLYSSTYSIPISSIEIITLTVENSYLQNF